VGKRSALVTVSVAEEKKSTFEALAKGFAPKTVTAGSKETRDHSDKTLADSTGQDNGANCGRSANAAAARSARSGLSKKKIIRTWQLWFSGSSGARHIPTGKSLEAS